MTMLDKYNSIEPVYGHYSMLEDGTTIFVQAMNYKESVLTPMQVVTLSEKFIPIEFSIWSKGFCILPVTLHDKVITIGIDVLSNSLDDNEELVKELDYYFKK